MNKFFKHTIHNHKQLVCALCLFFSLFFDSSAATTSVPVITVQGKEYVSLYDLIGTTPLAFTFDVFSQSAKLYYKTHSALLQEGLSVALVDGRLVKADYPIIRNKSEFLVPVAIFTGLTDSFYPDQVFVRKGHRYVASSEQGKSVIPATPSSKPPVHVEASPERIDFIVIDAGHGGKDPGALGKGKTKEKDLTLKVATLLYRYLKKYLSGVRVHLTRGKDVFLALDTRTEIANKMLKRNSNGLFVSIHANASVSSRISGFETYFLSQNPTNEDARATATLENNVIILENKNKRHKYSDVEYVEALMLTTQIQKESSILARSIQNTMRKNLKQFPSRGVKKADFFVLRGALMPAVLVEMGYVTHPKELKCLKTSSYQKKIAESVGKGVVSFVREYQQLIKK